MWHYAAEAQLHPTLAGSCLHSLTSLLPRLSDVYLLDGLSIPREARDLISKIRSCTVRSDLKNKQKTAENALLLRSDLTVQDRILEIRSLASLGSHILECSTWAGIEGRVELIGALSPPLACFPLRIPP